MKNSFLFVAVVIIFLLSLCHSKPVKWQPFGPERIYHDKKEKITITNTDSVCVKKFEKVDTICYKELKFFSIKVSNVVYKKKEFKLFIRVNGNYL